MDRWKFNHGAFYYMPPAEVRHLWDGKAWFRLGKTLPEAMAAWAERAQSPARITTISSLLDRYALEVVPKKAPKTQTENIRHIARLRPVFGAMALGDIEPQDVYRYIDKRSAKTAAKREVEVLSHAFTQAVKWGLIRAHPFKGEVVIEKEAGAGIRTRYVEDWELAEVMALQPRRRKGSIGMIQAYLRLKLLTGLRQRDLLLLTMSDLADDGIHVTPSKTKRSTGKRMIYEWTPELRAAIDACVDVRPALSPFLFCNRFGAGFVEADGTAGDWNNMWQKFMARVLRETNIKERFTEHDLRAKVGSDAPDLERARELMGHADAKITERVYRRKAIIIRPTK